MLGKIPAYYSMQFWFFIIYRLAVLLHERGANVQSPMPAAFLLAVRGGDGHFAHLDQHPGPLLRAVQGGGGAARRVGGAVRFPLPAMWLDREARPL